MPKCLERNPAWCETFPAMFITTRFSDGRKPACNTFSIWQIRMSTNRLIVDAKVYDDFVDLFTA